MNWKATLALLALALGGAWFLWRDPGGTRDASFGDVLVFPAVDGTRSPMERLQLESTDGRAEFVRGADGRWDIVAPVADRADAQIIGEIVGALESLPRLDRLAPGSRLAEMGLEPPLARIIFVRRAGQPRELQLGNRTAVEGRIYARVKGEEDVIVIPKGMRDLVQRPGDLYRDRRLTAVSASNIVRVSIRNPRGALLLSRENGKWEIKEPIQARANAAVVDEWLEKFAGFAVRSFITTDLGDLFEFGLAAPRATVRLELESKTGRALDPVEWSLGDRAAPNFGKDAVYLRSPERHAIVTVPLESEEVLYLTADALRERTLTALNLDFIDRVRVRRRGEPALLLARAGDDWELREPERMPAEAAEMTRLVKRLNDAAVTEFVRDEAVIAQGFAGGIDLECVFAAYASEVTAESGAGETPAVTLQFSSALPNGTRLVRNVEERIVARLPASIVDEIPARAVEWQRLRLVDATFGELLRFEVTRGGEAPVSVTFASSGWRLESGGSAPLEVARAQSLATLLGRLRAARWIVPAQDQDFGFAKPSLVVNARFARWSGAFEFRVGRQTEGGLWFAKVEDRFGIVLLSDPDVQLMLRPLLAAP